MRNIPPTVYAGIAVFALDGALQVSGYQNSLLAWMLFLMGAAFLTVAAGNWWKQKTSENEKPRMPQIMPASATQDPDESISRRPIRGLIFEREPGLRFRESIVEGIKRRQERERQEKRKRLWTLREEGVQLRNSTIRPDEHAQWHARFEDWHGRLLREAEALDPELKAWLQTLDKVKQWNLGLWMNSAHRHQLDMLSEILDRLQRYLEKQLT